MRVNTTLLGAGALALILTLGISANAWAAGKPGRDNDCDRINSAFGEACNVDGETTFDAELLELCNLTEDATYFGRRGAVDPNSSNELTLVSKLIDVNEKVDALKWDDASTKLIQYEEKLDSLEDTGDKKKIDYDDKYEMILQLADVNSCFNQIRP